jgi:hypothetical protein
MRLPSTLFKKATRHLDLKTMPPPQTKNSTLSPLGLRRRLWILSRACSRDWIANLLFCLIRCAIERKWKIRVYQVPLHPYTDGRIQR